MIRASQTPAAHVLVVAEMRRNTTAFLLTTVFCVGISAQSAPPVDLANATIADLNIALNAGRLTAETLTAMYLARIDGYDKQGPTINAVISLNPNALRGARALDAERKAGRVRGPLMATHPQQRSQCPGEGN